MPLMVGGPDMANNKGLPWEHIKYFSRNSKDSNNLKNSKFLIITLIIIIEFIIIYLIT